MCMQIRMCVQLDAASIGFSVTAKPVLYGHSKIDKKPILMTNGSLMKVESIAECCNTFDLHQVIISREGPLKTGFTVFNLIFEEKCN